jgi:hypothetical protein
LRLFGRAHNFARTVNEFAGIQFLRFRFFFCGLMAIERNECGNLYYWHMKKMNFGFILGLLLLSWSCNKPFEPESHFLPKGYRGPVVIIYNQKDGLIKEYLDGRRIYRIPKSGILKTQFDENNCEMPYERRKEFVKFFYIENNEIVENIPWKDSLIMDQPNILMASPQVSGGFTYEGIQIDDALYYQVDSTNKMGTYRPFKFDKSRLETWDE